MQRRKAKDETIETLRGLAIVLLVTFHAVPGGIFRAADSTSFVDHLTFTTMYIRMPLFTVISGYVYALRPVRSGHAGRFLRGKARRLLLPLVTLTTATYVLRGEPLAGLPGALTARYEHFWFLQAISLVFVLTVFLEVRGKLQSAKGWLTCFGCALAAQQALRYGLAGLAPLEAVLPFFSLEGAFGLAPFFLFGLGLRRFPALLHDRWLLRAACIMLAVGMALQQLAWFGLPLVDIAKTGTLGIFVGLASCYLLFRFRFRQRHLAAIGSHAYSIYLMHGFGLAVGSRVALRFGACAITQVVVKTVHGLALPLWGDWVLKRYRVTRRLVLGLR